MIPKRAVLFLLMCLIATLPCGCSHQSVAKTKTQVKKMKENNIKPIPVEKVIVNPETYIDKTILVEGVVKKTESKLVFHLGCEDACVSMPVEYDMEPGQTVVIQGKTQKRKDGKFIFVAEKIIQQ